MTEIEESRGTGQRWKLKYRPGFEVAGTQLEIFQSPNGLIFILNIDGETWKYGPFDINLQSIGPTFAVRRVF